MKKTKQKLSATWEILSTAEYVESLDRDVNDDDLVKIYQGSFVPLFLAHRVDRKQIWNVVIKTTAKADDGTIHEHEMEWSFNKLMSIKEVISGAKHIKVERDGLKLRWSGVSDQWIKAVDEDLKGLTAVSAWATATCVGMVEQVNPAATLLSRIQGMVAA
ncbi:hypothetical protein F7P73_17310 [Acinetobacter bohemicus]|uniref:Uncharacterized protein n=1 Tax=Acinetobacter bohemicus TaxID=1435036 RepID=A0A1I6WD15_9GAMM|nr:hypothetical protein [Acinetobacter bohemicus]KAB0650131.1 hypothetical protein F7P73_17310 [Acinetobacter bohemicus]SFT23890.1 hypothetical protein SAMN05444586_10558 [Acinetobacter bohemicus]